MVVPPFRTQSVNEVEALLDAPGTLVVDVREPHELAATGFIPGAVAIPLSQVAEAVAPSGAGRANPAFDAASTIVFYCAAGARSARAAGVAAEAGLPGIVNMQGGFTAWANAGLPIER